MNQHFFLYILHVERLSKPCNKQYWELQTFALVHSHNTDNIIIVAYYIRLRKIKGIGLKLIYISDKIKHALTIFLKIVSFLYEHIDICLSAPAHRSCTDKPVKSRLVKNISYDIAERHEVLILL